MATVGVRGLMLKPSATADDMTQCNHRSGRGGELEGHGVKQTLVSWSGCEVITETLLMPLHSRKSNFLSAPSSGRVISGSSGYIICMFVCMYISTGVSVSMQILVDRDNVVLNDYYYYY